MRLVYASNRYTRGFNPFLDGGHPLTRGLVGAWLLNEGAGASVYDLIGPPITGTLVNGSGGAGWLAPNMFGDFGINFNGPNDYVGLGDAFPSLGKAFTVSAWARSTLDPLSGAVEIATYRSTTTSGEIGFQFDINNADVRMISGKSGDYAAASYSSAITTRTWFHAIGIRNGAATQVYVNGVKGGTDGSNSNPTPSVNSLNIGALVNGSTTRANGWSGNIVNFLVYNRVLSPEEIVWLYNEPLGFVAGRRGAFSLMPPAAPAAVPRSFAVIVG